MSWLEGFRDQRELIEWEDQFFPEDDRRADRIWDWSDDLRVTASRQEGRARFDTAPFRPHVRRVLRDAA